MPVSISSGDFIDPDNYTSALDDHETRLDLLEGGNPRVRAFTSSSITIADSTQTAVVFGGATYDAGGMYAGGSSTDLNIPKQGIYLVTAFTVWHTNGAGIREIEIQRDGSSEVVTSQTFANTTRPTKVNVSADAVFNVAEFIRMLVFQDSGGDLDLIGAWLTARYVGDTS